MLFDCIYWAKPEKSPSLIKTRKTINGSSHDNQLYIIGIDPDELTPKLNCQLYSNSSKLFGKYFLKLQQQRYRWDSICILQHELNISNIIPTYMHLYVCMCIWSWNYSLIINDKWNAPFSLYENTWNNSA